MRERMTHLPQGSGENLATRINYSSKVKGAFGMAIFGMSAIALQNFERSSSGQSLPIFMKGRLADVMAAPAYVSLNKFFFGDDFVMNFGGTIVILTLIEIAQKVGSIKGTFDAGDITAYVVGELGWAAFEGTAKVIHDSGLSLPIYRALGIQHRKFD